MSENISERALVVEYDMTVSELIKAHLLRSGRFEEGDISFATTTEEANELIGNNAFALMLVRANLTPGVLGGNEGAAVVASARGSELNKDSYIVAYSGSDSIATADKNIDSEESFVASLKTILSSFRKVQ